MAKPVCPKCKGRLIAVVEYVEGGGKLDVIKCQICGHRVKSREHVEPAVVKPAVTATASSPAASEKTPYAFDPETHAPTAEPLAVGIPGRKRKAVGCFGTPPCLDCGRPGMKIVSRGLCSNCWSNHKDGGTLEKFPKSDRVKRFEVAKRNTPPCADCGRPGLKHVGRGLCTSCMRRNKKAGTLKSFARKGRIAVPVAPAVEGAEKQPTLTIVFGSERDAELLAKLERHAGQSRRELTQHVLWLLEQGVA